MDLAFVKYPQCIELFPDEYKTESLCLQAVSSDGELLKSVPEKLRTYDICYAAAIHGAGIENIPEDLIGHEDKDHTDDNPKADCKYMRGP